MSKLFDVNEELLKEKIKTLLDDDNQIKRWNEGILIKSLILLPIIIFVVGLFVVNRPESLMEVLLTFIYPLALISIGLIIMFVMRSNLK